MKRIKINHLFNAKEAIDPVLIKGWLRTKRDSKGFSFLEINDGSCLANIQVVADEKLPNYSDVRKLTTGSALGIVGAMVESPGKGQQWELLAQKIELLGKAPETYPLQKKRHTDEFLRSIAHLRPRTNKYGAVFRIRSELALAIHRFFNDRDFKYIHTPILTASDCEGAGEMFQVTTRGSEAGQTLDPVSDFFGKEANLTVSGQLSAELFALALGDVYTFGPTFRAENSNTRRHAAEFWMVEPEMAFCELTENMDLAEALVQHLTQKVLDNCHSDLLLFSRFVDKTLMDSLATMASATYARIPYHEAIQILSSSKKAFEFKPVLGEDLQSEHERYLTEIHFKKPVVVYNYPKTIKPFYMRSNDDDQTVAAMDLLVPGIGEIIGGSQREERLDVLEKRMDETGLQKESYWWYLDSRRYGSVVHSGFGLGFERMLMALTGVSNIRDVIPFPRTPKNIEF